MDRKYSHIVFDVDGTVKHKLDPEPLLKYMEKTGAEGYSGHFRDKIDGTWRDVMYKIANEEITIEVDMLGAELKSLWDHKTGREYMWEGDPRYWKRTSPILFPLVGNYKNKETSYQGNIYKMPQHGCARDMEFELISRTEDTIWFGVDSTAETLKIYPFSFRLELGYRLEGRTVEVLWRVINRGHDTMYFSIGGHPAFKCPLHQMENQTDYYILFDVKDKVISRRIGEDGLASDILDTYTLDDGYLPVSADLFDHDALVIENQPVHSVALADADKRPYLKMRFDVPLFGIWSPPGKHAPFVCIEPWYGRCDHAGFEGTLKEREFGNQLEPGEQFEASYYITLP